MKLISIIVPCYNEEDVLPMFYEEIQKVMDQMKQEHSELSFEMLFIDDGSKDKTLQILRKMSLQDQRVRYISFSRNFGKEAGMYAGLENSRGDFVVVMDADLQHPPAFLPKMYNFVKDGEYDCATTRRVSRDGESKIRSAFARLFYKIMNKISQTEIVDGAQDFRFMSRQMVNAILDMHEYNRFSKGIFSWVGFKTRYIEYENVERPAGTSSWSFWGLFKYSLEGIFAFSTAPLAIAAVLGAFICALALILLIFFIVKACVVDEPDLRFLAAMCIMSLLAGLQLFSVGILGQYLSRTYLEVKHRPIYLMRENEELYRARREEEDE
ncbi:MAG: glycosyltransferase family 2 protein [Oscillospiraceae bacterium]|nr:glycosyltransferase family 2 protein [Oscillospiraceae bacterium]